MTEPDTYLPPEDEADLVALADGNLPRARRAEVEARVAGEPAFAAALERQRRALAMLAGLTTPAPLELRLRVEELKAHRRRLRRRRWIPMAFLASASATAALLFVLVSGGPVVEDVFAVGLRPATAPAAAGEQVDGLRFPAPREWRAVGARRDVVEGRETRTVFYEKAGKRIAYTIVARPALGDGKRSLRGADGRKGFTWTRAGRTCVISGDVDPAVLAKAAAWR
jgi:anti-sigma factor RsiW